MCRCKLHRKSLTKSVMTSLCFLFCAVFLQLVTGSLIHFFLHCCKHFYPQKNDFTLDSFNLKSKRFISSSIFSSLWYKITINLQHCFKIQKPLPYLLKLKLKKNCTIISAYKIQIKSEHLESLPCYCQSLWCSCGWNLLAPHDPIHQQAVCHPLLSN